MATSSETTLFQSSVSRILDSWTALRLAVEHGFGGTESREKAEWMVFAIDQWFTENKNLDPYEVEEFLADILSTEFDTVADDGSLSQIAAMICGVHRLCSTGDEGAVQERLSKLPKPSIQQCSRAPGNDEDEDDDDNDDMDTGHVQPPSQQSGSRSQSSGTSSATENLTNGTYCLLKMPRTKKSSEQRLKERRKHERENKLNSEHKEPPRKKNKVNQSSVGVTSQLKPSETLTPSTSVTTELKSTSVTTELKSSKTLTPSTSVTTELKSSKTLTPSTYVTTELKSSKTLTPSTSVTTDLKSTSVTTELKSSKTLTPSTSVTTELKSTSVTTELKSTSVTTELKSSKTLTPSTSVTTELKSSKTLIPLTTELKSSKTLTPSTSVTSESKSSKTLTPSTSVTTELKSSKTLTPSTSLTTQLKSQHQELQYAFIEREITIQRKWKLQNLHDTKDKYVSQEDGDISSIHPSCVRVANWRKTLTEDKKTNLKIMDKKRKADKNKSLDEDARNELKAKARKLMQDKRKSLHKEAKEELAIKDQKRKQDKRKSLDELAKEELAKKDQKRKQDKRKSLDEEARHEFKAKAKKQMQDKRKSLDEVAKEELAKKGQKRKQEKRKSLDELAKEELAKKDQKRKQDKRKSLDEEARHEFKAKAKKQMQDKRKSLDEVAKEEVAKKDQKRKQEKRKSLDELAKEELAKKDQKRKQDKRKSLDEEARNEFKAKGKKQMQDKRKSLDEVAKEELAKKDQKRKQEKRKSLDELAKEELAKKDQKRKQDKRKSLDELAKEELAKKDQKRKQDKRKSLDEEARNEFKAKAKKQMQDKRKSLDEVAKEELAKKDQKRKQDKRKSLDEEARNEFKAKAKKQMQDKRKSLDEVAKEELAKKDQKRKQEKRKSLDELAKEELAKKDQKRKQVKRKSLDEEANTFCRVKDRNKKKEQRAVKTSTSENAVQTFLQRIRNGPTSICIVCHRLMYRECVSLYNETTLSNCDEYLLEACNTQKRSADGEQYICNTCSWNLKRNLMPVQAVANSLSLDNIPEQLSDLSTLESTLISRRILFIKILALPRGKQKAVHGCVVNVPVNPEETCSILPRLPSSSSCITVKLKRKIEYRGHVIVQSIRPWKIMESLQHLKDVEKNPHYQDVIINDNWKEDCTADNQPLWEALTGLSATENDNGTLHVLSSASNDTDQPIEQEPESDSEESDNEIEDRTEINGLPYDSCLQPKDISADKDFLLNIAPGEGKRPIGMFADKHSEEMAFPTLFPSGTFGFDCQRERQISLVKYFNQRILNCDNRFAASTEYLFYAQYRSEAKKVADCLSIAMRKCKGQHQVEKITAGQIKNVEEMRRLARTDLSYHFLQNVRGSPAFFNKLLYDLLGMIRQLGSCTWFLTLSSADMKWKDTIQVIAAQQNQNLSDEQIENMTWEQKSTWLRTNPVTAARHFDHRLQLFMSTIVLGKSQPIGEIQDFKYRIEFQQRGSPHCHMLLWVKNAPSVSKDSLENVASFIDKYVSCSIPSDDDLLASLIGTVQRHTHSFTCKSHGTKCRFAFPKPPVSKTTVVLPPEDIPNKATQTIYTELLTAVMGKLEDVQNQTDLTLEALLEEIHIPEDMYMKALTWIKTKQGQPAILYRRNPLDCFINNFSPTLMKAWQANLDLQFVTNVYACIMYVASYVSKPEKTLGDVLKSVSKNSAPAGPKKMMETVSKKFLSHREISAQEAVYRLLPLPLTKGSRQVIFLHTDFAENRTKLLKPMKVIQELDDDDENLYQEGMLEKYQMRPDSIEHICLADFAANYSYARKVNAEPDPDLLDEDLLDPDIVTDITNLPKSIKLKNKSTTMSLRSRPVIIRCHQFSILKQPEQYYHSKLLLYKPWRDESKDLLDDDGTYKTKYINCRPDFSEKMNFYEPNNEEYTQAVEELQENGPPEDAWALLVPQTEQQEREDRTEGAQQDPEFEAIVPAHGNETSDLGLVSYQYEVDNRKISFQQWLGMTVSLNSEQREIHQFIVEWCIEMSMTYKTGKRPNPFHIFISGGAGTGKSHLIRTIVQTVNRLLSVGQGEDDIVVMVCAFTGVAAFNIEGHTLHSAFNLPVNQSKRDDYIRLSGEQLSIMRGKLGNLCLLIIDEISMVGADHLYTVHRRLSEIMTSDDPFGGVSVLAVGDLSQLPPVAQKPVFDPVSDCIASLYGSLWKKNFSVLELYQMMRQKDDVQFADALNRIRLSKHTEEDIDLIKTRETDVSSPSYPTKALHIFAFNKDVDNHNNKMLESIESPVITVTAIDSKTDQQTGRIDNIAFDEKKKPGGMLKELKIAEGARVMMTTNVDTSDGLTNSATGTVTGFLPSYPQPSDPQFSEYRPKYVLVQFDETRVGEKLRSKLQRILPDETSTPIAVHEVTVKHRKITAKRTQFPLTLAWGVTIHKAQGRTVEELVVSMNGSFKAGQMYTALSRVKTKEGLYILGEFQSSKISSDRRTIKEMERIRKDKKFKLCVPLTVTVPSESFFKISILNINSLRPHLQCLSVDPYIKTSDIVAISETWLTPSSSTDSLELSPEFELYRQDYFIQHKRPQGGVATYVKKSFRVLSEMRYEGITLQYQCLLLSLRMNPRKRLIVLLVYSPPNTQNQEFFLQLDSLITLIPTEAMPTILCGDFNLKSTDVKSKTLTDLTQYHGFIEYGQSPTHRRGGSLDHVYLNNYFDESEILNVIPVHYSDHFHVHLAVPWMQLF